VTGRRRSRPELADLARLTGAAAAALALAACHQGGAPGGGAGPVTSSSVAPQSFASIVKTVSPAVVSVHVVAAVTPPTQAGPVLPGPFGLAPGQGGAPEPELVEGLGSGFLISPDGYIVTNDHVVNGSRDIQVSLSDDRTFKARVVGVDKATDLAVLKIPGRGLPYVSFEDAAKPEVGDWVLAVGSPFGLGGTATAGIVSAYAREIGESYVSYIQTDAAINRGNSGGPMFDVRGHVIGVNTAILSPSGGSIGIGFAIPADLANRITRELIEHGKVTRGYIGAAVRTLSPALAEAAGLDSGPNAGKGALVVAVTAGGPAARAGLQRGDLVTAIDGQAVASSTDLVRKVADARPGQSLTLKVLRGGRSLDLKVQAGDRPSS
jgi:serine protease Do